MFTINEHVNIALIKFGNLVCWVGRQRLKRPSVSMTDEKIISRPTYIAHDEINYSNTVSVFSAPKRKPSLKRNVEYWA